MQYFRTARDLQDFLKEHDLIYYKIVGGLGNQLFGLSAAYQLSQQYGKRIGIDVSNLDHSPQEGPEWSDWHGIKGWSELFRTSKDVPSLPTWNLINPIGLGSRDFTHFTGWRLSLGDILESGLFKLGELPFNFDGYESSALAIHIRGGDYRKAKGIGLLDPSYYRRAIETLGACVSSDTTIFTDDEDYANSIIDRLNIRKQIKYSRTDSALGVLTELSLSEAMIGSNSTLSWWAAFFSKSTNKILPRPFYLQDWNVDQEIRLTDVHYMGRFPNKFIECVNYLNWKHLRS